MRLYVVLMAGNNAMDAQAIFASADPHIVGAVTGHLHERTTPEEAPATPARPNTADGEPGQ